VYVFFYPNGEQRCINIGAWNVFYPTSLAHPSVSLIAYTPEEHSVQDAASFHARRT